ncbi:unnamed protein product [Cylicocyclus nassatus]|uniref:BTB domain-containing protein n=1 Tax=Cylicocyclus nassatus TaxID=53992 RepID=A0AA36HC36_CYLNA|nr:unnamed protein product [Cylicocyclus nassatus]
MNNALKRFSSPCNNGREEDQTTLTVYFTALQYQPNADSDSRKSDHGSLIQPLDVLDYLRDGKYVVLPEDDYSLECLQREAEFYNLPSLVEICFSKRSVNHTDKLDNSSNRSSRVKINVGGTVFETLLSTLTKHKDSVFSAMLANRRQGQEELFFDRESELFPMVMDYLRYGKISAVPVDRHSQAKLRREAEFYNLPGLLKCMFKPFDKVQLVEGVIEEYCLLNVEKSYNGRTINQCKICDFTVHPAYHPSYLMTTYIGIEKGVVDVTYGVPLGQTLPMSEIKSTTGSVSRIDSTCCIVEWNDHQATHLPKTALRLIEIR